jgi:hypothetical protein
MLIKVDIDYRIAYWAAYIWTEDVLLAAGGVSFCNDFSLKSNVISIKEGHETSAVAIRKRVNQCLAAQAKQHIYWIPDQCSLKDTYRRKAAKRCLSELR